MLDIVNNTVKMIKNYLQLVAKIATKLGILSDLEPFIE